MEAASELLVRGGRYDLSASEFNDLATTARTSSVKVTSFSAITFHDGSAGTAIQLSFYASKTYDYAFGTATIYTQGSSIVGFHDFYDFDSKPFFQRAVKAEIATRTAATVAPSTAQPFHVCYGRTPSNVGC
jgi:hypothetical protein